MIARILSKTLKWRPFKFMHVQKLLPTHHAQRKAFCQWILSQPEDFPDRVLWSDEKWWVLHQGSNRQNDRYWAAHNPHEFIENKVQGDVKAMSWVGVMDSQVVSVHWFVDGDGDNVSVNQERYLKMLREDVYPKVIQKFGSTANYWFQQDGATCHTTKNVLKWLEQKFQTRIISRNADKRNRGGVNWPSRSPDLNPLDFWYWSHVQKLVKDGCQVNNQYVHPATIEEIMEKVEQASATLTPDVIKKSCRNIRKRAQMCLDQNGKHFQHLIKHSRGH